MVDYAAVFILGKKRKKISVQGVINSYGCKHLELVGLGRSCDKGGSELS